MRFRLNGFVWLLASVVLLGLATTAQSAPTLLTVSGTIDVVEGSYVGDFVAGQPFIGTFIYDTDESNAAPSSITTPSNVPGHEFSSFYDFLGAAYDVVLSFPAIPATFDSETVSVVVNDDLFLAAEDVNGAVSDGLHDWIEILGSTAIGICLEPGGVCEPNEYSPADGEEWTLAIFSDTGWISDGSLVPDDFPSTYTALVVGIEVDVAGVETGLVLADVVVTGPTIISVPTVPGLGVPGALLLGGALSVVGCGIRIRRRTDLAQRGGALSTARRSRFPLRS